MRKLFIVLLLALAAVAGWFYFNGQQTAQHSGSRSLPTVTAWPVTLGEFTDEVSALGTLRARESVDITSSVSDVVVGLHFEDGDRVEAGQKLVTLRQDEEQAALRVQQENLADAEREVERLKNLAQRNQVAQTDLDAERTRAAVARHSIEEVRARLENLNIAAPFSGQLGLRLVSLGALVTPGQRITTLDDDSLMRLDFTVGSAFLPFIQVGRTINARTPAYNRSFSGTVSAVDSRVDTVSRSITARAVLPNEDGLLKPGMLMEVRLLGATREALLLPEEALVSRAAEHYVWLLDGDSARRTQVTIGSRRPGWVEVTSGLQVGDVVVRDGVGKLRGTEAQVALVEG